MTHEMKVELPELQWFGKKASHGDSTDADVTISIQQRAKGSVDGNKRLGIVFRHGLFKNLNSSYVQFAIMKNRIYFRGVMEREGYKISDKGTGNGYIAATINQSEVKQLEAFRGDYSLKYDGFYELYYIERAEE